MFALFFLNNPIGIWLKGKLYTFILLAILAALLFGVYKYVSNRFEELDKLKVTTAEQTQLISDLQEASKKLKESDAVTASSIEDLGQAQQDIEKRSRARVADVNNKIKVITEGAMTEEQKTIAISKTYMDSLQKSYCVAKPATCAIVAKEEVK
jgi:cell division protein FtsB